jgi:hypothetical protein
MGSLHVAWRAEVQHVMTHAGLAPAGPPPVSPAAVRANLARPDTQPRASGIAARRATAIRATAAMADPARGGHEAMMAGPAATIDRRDAAGRAASLPRPW